MVGRVGDWRAGLGRSLCSLLARSFVCECHTTSAVPRFQPPPRRTQHADFPHCALLFSSPDRDSDLGVEADERRILSAHVPETHVLSADNADMLAERKAGFVFKPRHGYASRGLLDSASVGHGRLRRLLRRGEGYVAQRRIAKAAVQVEGRRLWADLRVWAYRGEILILSGRASRRPDRLDLTPPGGWLPTYVSP